MEVTEHSTRSGVGEATAFRLCDWPVKKSGLKAADGFGIVASDHQRGYKLDAGYKKGLRLIASP